MTPAQRVRILVAEDDRVLQELVAELLSEAGYEVVTASDGDEALKLVREQAPDLVLLDVTMPRLDGYTVCREIRASGPGAPPVIFLTAHGNVDDRVSGLDLGAVDYLVKPFNPPELEARVRAALRTKAALDALAADATTDALTGLLSRRQGEARAEEAVFLARRHLRPLTCLVLGVDGFEGVAERCGPGAGEAITREVGRRLRGICRRSDVVARYGDSAFVLLLPETDGHGGVAAAIRIRRWLGAAPVLLPAPNLPLLITVSAGVAAWTAALEDGRALLDAAAQALSRARQLGPGTVLRAA
jgi:diguanylate cyclase (GGDEF)-like protein